MPTPGDPPASRELKRDVFGRVELIVQPTHRFVRRTACGNGWPGTSLIARWLLRREARALSRLSGLRQVPQLAHPLASSPNELHRTWCEGEPLWTVTELPRDFFDRLRELVIAMHARGVCHNDLHKENNILVGPDGTPRLVDFQLASVHLRDGGRFRRRCAEDLRHIEKHRHRYDTCGAITSPSPRPLAARLWLRFAKPVYNRLTRKLFASGRGEPRRPRVGPWPRRTTP